MDRIRELIGRYPRLGACEGSVREVCALLEAAFAGGGKLLIAGNGGSAADADHIAGELMKGFVRKRPVPPAFGEALARLADADTAAYLTRLLQRGLPVINLSAHAALLTATLNDTGGDIVFAQQVFACGTARDALLCISTSGNSRNVCLAAITAKACGIKVAALTGGSGGRLAALSDAAVIVPETEAFKVQELHLPVYHAVCLALEERFFG